ncbi:MAG: hypothetical protein H6721_00510 [Sandaracinus sp.]|nr:hypothetical protein [Sandaracinus sp.]
MSMRLVVAAIVVVSALCSAPAHAQLFSPGPLSRFHADLEGDDHCGDCHSSGRQVRNTLCLSCHEDLARRVNAGQGLHGGEYRGRPCAPCHVEHLGRNVPQIRWPGGNKNAFDHRLAGWPLRGAHQRQECAGCHDRGRSFLGLSTRCASCHEDPHEGRFGNECQTCHDETRWSRVDLESFDHGRARFPLRGAHRRVECARCHHDPPQYRGIAFSSCTSCHTDPHAGRFGAECSRCHNETTWTNVERFREQHPVLSLANGHADVACGDCHDRGTVAAPSRGSRCVNCHRPVHEAPFGRNCIECHRSIRWLGLPRRIGLDAHGRTAFALGGAHVDVECASCHSPELPRNERYRELEFERCGSCHRDPHEFAFRGAEGFDCASCHTDADFAPSRFALAYHAATAFPLTGSHTDVACSGCHGSVRPRLRYRVADQTCAGCHENPHGDQFAAEMARGGCATCHQTTSWHQPNIAHDTWPLTGAHARAACDSCHHPTQEDREQGRGASYRGVPRVCEGCHEDDHAGQFRTSAPIRACPQCHTTEAFEIHDFDHAARTGFALTGRHEGLPCVGCHRSEALANGTQVVRWRLGYRACADCHANPHERRERAQSSDAGVAFDVDADVLALDEALDAGVGWAFAGPTTPPDFAHPDLAHPDFAHPDFAHPDFAHPDFAHPDFAHPDFAHPDFAHSDFAHPDFAHPDFAHPDFAHSDFADFESCPRADTTDAVEACPHVDAVACAHQDATYEDATYEAASCPHLAFEARVFDDGRTNAHDDYAAHLDPSRRDVAHLGLAYAAPTEDPFDAGLQAWARELSR